MNIKHKYYFASITAALLLLTGCQQSQNSGSNSDSSTQAVTGTQATESETDSTTEPQTTEPETDITTEAQTTAPAAAPLSNIVNCDKIKLPDDIRSFDKIERTSDGFSGIAYCNKDSGKIDMAYLHISEDMQTVEKSLLTPPEKQEDYSLLYQYFALEGSDIWSFAIMESHGGLKPYDPQTDGDSYDWEKWNAAKQEQYILCHYDKNGSLLSTIPVNELQDYRNPQNGEFGNVKSFDCVDEALYMTIFDDRVLQINKETAGVTLVSDLCKDDTYYNGKLLCFDRDNKPVLLQEKVTYAPDKHSINEAVVSEFDIESSSCGQALYTTGDNWDRAKISVIKGCGEYRFFINTYSELIGIKDDGTQEVLIDIYDSDLDTQIKTSDNDYVPYTDDLFDINIIPVDDTQFLGFYQHYPECRTDGFCLTRKPESELG